MDEKPSAKINLPARLDEDLVEKIKSMANQKDVPVNEIIEQAIAALERQNSTENLQSDLYDMEEMLRTKFRHIDDRISDLESSIATFAEAIVQQKNTEPDGLKYITKPLLKFLLSRAMEASAFGNAISIKTVSMTAEDEAALERGDETIAELLG